MAGDIWTICKWSKRNLYCFNPAAWPFVHKTKPFSSLDFASLQNVLQVRKAQRDMVCWLQKCKQQGHRLPERNGKYPADQNDFLSVQWQANRNFINLDHFSGRMPMFIFSAVRAAPIMIATSLQTPRIAPSSFRADNRCRGVRQISSKWMVECTSRRTNQTRVTGGYVCHTQKIKKQTPGRYDVEFAFCTHFYLAREFDSTRATIGRDAWHANNLVSAYMAGPHTCREEVVLFLNLELSSRVNQIHHKARVPKGNFVYSSNIFIEKRGL